MTFENKNFSIIADDSQAKQVAENLASMTFENKNFSITADDSQAKQVAENLKSMFSEKAAMKVTAEVETHVKVTTTKEQNTTLGAMEKGFAYLLEAVEDLFKTTEAHAAEIPKILER